MNLNATKRHWEKFARTDPLWAVLTDPGKEGNQWNIDEFFATGVHAVAADMATISNHLPGLRRGTALDFGCGVGRLSQALAGHFQNVVGVDISEEMIRLARQHNRHGDRVEYVLNTQPELLVFPDRRFDFVYSFITLQHMEPVYAQKYIAEFVRVTAPGGGIFFQVPTGKVKPRPFTLWPDTLLKRLARDLRRRVIGPMMEMHAMPREVVTQILTQAGAELVDCYPCDSAGSEVTSLAYLARRR